ncbi:hypothetical protein [Pseudomonas syringae]|uniref:Uncharacterized protein n=1 Tax=Pseudomonas syringae pv. aceris TaxID=199198 RepID=A0A0L8IW91_PSESX|nr:hypothetical protein [Pseudomonas syringae]EGH74417.1 hypothetical protein PSYAR_28096 [Pseudomonas syringae pv. aceris str. M302273]KOG05650.1 Uncharacterized protein ABJ98_0400 [Pseudomonas syringae pv. aceris]KPW08237.1 Uncharacterized protein ALO91_02824 [Pseudomonas syringae pv. aceris]
MELSTADIEVYTSDDDPIGLIGIPFTFNPGERTIYTGADNTSAAVLRAGWLGLKTEPFKGWQSAHVLSVTGSNGDDRVFEVTRNFNNPLQEGDWLWFPAMPGEVAPFRT